MIFYILTGTALLFLGVLLGLKIRTAGKELNNENLKQVGTIWLVIIGLTLITGIISSSQLGLINFDLGKPSVCDCISWNEEARKEMKDAKDEAAKKAVEDKWKDKEETCMKLGQGKTDEEKKAMMEEAKSCK